MKRVLAILMAAAGVSHAAVSQLACTGTAQQTVIRAEGLAERVGDIVLHCQANVPGGDVVSSVQVVLSAPVANASAATLVVERGGVVVQTLNSFATGDTVVSFPPINAALDSSGQASIRISGLRVNATGKTQQQITALIGTTGATGLGVFPNPVTPAVVQPGLLVNSTTTNIVCLGSPAPGEDPLSLAGLFSAGTAVSTLRATEGSSDAFQVRLAGAGTGTRLLVKLSGFPEGARVFLPEAIAGSSATQATSAGELGLPRSGGRYTPGATGSLLLSLVVGANANGIGGVPLVRPDAPGAPTTVLLGAREIGLTNGAGVAVFEVVDSNSTIFESAQIPVFLALPANSNGRGAVAQASIVLGPISTGPEVPRFAANQSPGLDCTVLNDCNAGYFPHLEVEAPPLEYSAQLGAQVFLSKRVIVRNSRGGLMPWQARWVYENGSGWLNVVSPTGVNQAAFQLDALIGKITAPGVYRATLIVDAGALAGTVQLPVRFEVTAGAPDATLPLIGEAFNAADAAVKTLVPGSRAVLRGVRLQNAGVAFNGLAATVIQSTAERVEVVVPEGLGPAASAQVRVTTPGTVSAPFEAALALSAPAIYAGAVYNQDNQPNTSAAPETAGRILQIFATGLPLAVNGRISAKINGQPIADLPYAGDAPGFTGVQQVNLRLPRLAAGGADLALCGVANNTGAEVCGPAVRIYIGE